MNYKLLKMFKSMEWSPTNCITINSKRLLFKWGFFQLSVHNANRPPKETLKVEILLYTWYQKKWQHISILQYIDYNL